MDTLMVHVASLKEIEQRFGTTTPRRQFLFARLKLLFDGLVATGAVKHLYLFGSFVSGKPSPNDIDLLVVMNSGFTTVNLSGKTLEIFQHDICKIHYHADVFRLPKQLAMIGLPTCWMSSPVIGRDKNKTFLR